MQQTGILAGTITILICVTIVLMLAAGFGVDLIQAVSQAMPAIMLAGVVISLATVVLRRELA